MPIDDETIRKLTVAAKDASERAYCPYSRFKVGAAVLTADGEVSTGANVENASYGLTICAERSAIFRAVNEGKRQVVAVVVYTPTSHPTAPCGACRQVIQEFGPRAEVFGVCDGADSLRATLDTLLPHAFGPDSL